MLEMVGVFLLGTKNKRTLWPKMQVIMVRKLDPLKHHAVTKRKERRDIFGIIIQTLKDL